ncbi:similar to Saccharomyces cerevisiae YGR075C PRP38 Unique component of the U4/U6.U5 tri-snRNP particle [Maudiozyma saulgeensis]|uniref:Pre-mRNA-splicing factor 38 n=1 Tax=Maudiozyma saulgeensis TaxID=1789683 RepID=A0A1X7RCD1_9SACH|nr:similar to Saccharomyces cerevisiae YGR075C PRP38 Unique component of the U4/U6.U5 tri-snRNP particle [Kazachstania saulgeensis]
MSSEFHVESYISSKELNHQSVSLVIPRLTRDKIHNNIYYKVNLTLPSLHCDTFMGLLKVIIRDFGTLKGKSINQGHMLGGIMFKCILMKIVEMRPTIEQLINIIDSNRESNEFDDKYIVVLLLTYIRVQYYYLGEKNDLAKRFRSLFKKYLLDYRKMKSLGLYEDCTATSQNLNVSIIHMDEVLDQLMTKNDIWGIPLGRCVWCDVYDSTSDSDFDSESNSSTDDSEN